ncbi:MAG: AMP-binding protein, partial [Pseudomonadota bacterium]
MSSRQATFAECIQSHTGTPLLIHDKNLVYHDTLTAQALSLRTGCSSDSSYSVALQTRDPYQLILGLVAMDGYAQKLLILPPCTPLETSAALFKQEKITHLLSQEGLRRITNENQQSRQDEATNWLFLTSGTTGDPKILSHTFGGLTSKTASHVERATDLRWGLAYQAHRFAGIQVILQALISGRPLVLPRSSDAAKMAEAFVEHKVTALSATPSQWRQLLSQGQIRQCELRQITLGGEIADQAILSALQRAFPESRIAHIYASTEAGVGFSVSDGLAGFPHKWLNTDRTVRMKQSSRGTLMLRGSARSNSNAIAAELDPEG